MNKPKICPTCSGIGSWAFAARMLRKYDAAFYCCGTCGYLWADAPHWLDEAYAAPIARADTGIARRNLQTAEKLALLLFYAFDPAARFLDTGGGSGLLTRLMRDRGFDFWWEDAHCPNLFAGGFEASGQDAQYEAVTAFEVLEHLTDPAGFVDRQLGRSRSRTLIFSTELYAGPPPGPDWHYYAFAMGQHIGFFQRGTLEALALRFGIRFYSARGLHVLTTMNLDNMNLRKRIKPNGFWAWRAQRHFSSLVEDDQRYLLGLAPLPRSRVARTDGA